MPRLKWRTLGQSPAPASKPDGAPFEVVFFNQRANSVNLFWMDRAGVPKPYGGIASGSRKRQSTRPGATWLITDARDKPLGYFVIEDRTAQGIIPEDK